jgi:hypothetical protein
VVGAEYLNQLIAKLYSIEIRSACAATHGINTNDNINNLTGKV